MEARKSALHLSRYVSYTFSVRIAILASAERHGVTADEIRTVIAYAMVTVSIAARMDGAQPQLFIGPAANNEPWIEVIADLSDPQVATVFHAMMLRRSTAATAGIGKWSDIEYGPQRK